MNRSLIVSALAILAMLSGCTLPTSGADSTPVSCIDAMQCGEALGPGFDCDHTRDVCAAMCDKESDCAERVGPGYSCNFSTGFCVQ
jgi:hypothetical protein